MSKRIWLIIAFVFMIIMSVAVTTASAGSSASQYIEINHPKQADTGRQDVPITVKLTNPRNQAAEFFGYVEITWDAINDLAPSSADQGTIFWYEGHGTTIKQFWRGKIEGGKTVTFTTLARTGWRTGSYQLVYAEFMFNTENPFQKSDQTYLVVNSSSPTATAKPPVQLPSSTPTPTATATLAWTSTATSTAISTATRTSTPSPTQPATSTPTATRTPIPTISSSDGVRQVGQVRRNVTVKAGERAYSVFSLTSTNGWQLVDTYGYPTSYGAGINWEPTQVWLNTTASHSFNVQVNSNVPPGTYTGQIVLLLENTNKKVSLGEITVQVEASTPTATATRTATPTATPTGPQITSVSSLSVKPGDWVTIYGSGFLNANTDVGSLKVWLVHDSGGSNLLTAAVGEFGPEKTFVSWRENSIQFKIADDKVAQSGRIDVIVGDKFVRYEPRFMITELPTPTATPYIYFIRGMTAESSI